MLRPVERSMTVSAPQRIAHVIFSTSSSIDDETAELPMFALIFTRKLRPMIIGSLSGWLILAGKMGRPPGAFFRAKFRGNKSGEGAPENLAGGWCAGAVGGARLGSGNSAVFWEAGS